MTRPRLPIFRTIKRGWRDQSGSEALEMVYATAALCAIILSTLMILGYALQVNAVSYAGKRLARYVEITGVANETDLQTKLEEMLSNANDINAAVDVVNVSAWYNAADKRIQLRDTFTIRLTADYVVQLANPGDLSGFTIVLPIYVTVNGQSEVYWK